MWYLEKWANVYLEGARKRIQKLLKGYDLTIEDTYSMQNMCAYEVRCGSFLFLASRTGFHCSNLLIILAWAIQVVALGYSDFCSLFTREEWEGFEYALDLWFWCVIFPFNLYIKT
jgi:hypothetical protein